MMNTIKLLAYVMFIGVLMSGFTVTLIYVCMYAIEHANVFVYAVAITWLIFLGLLYWSYRGEVVQK